MTHTLIVCGLTEWERKEIKEHKGECKYCMHNDSFYNKDGFTRFCSKRNEKLEKEETDCKDWLLDTR